MTVSQVGQCGLLVGKHKVGLLCSVPCLVPPSLALTTLLGSSAMTGHGHQRLSGYRIGA
jgi:hypothetical protein